MTATATTKPPVPIGKKFDFHFEAQKGVALVTPLNHRAYEYATVALKGCPMWGRSYVMQPKRAQSLRSSFVEREQPLRILASKGFNKISQS